MQSMTMGQLEARRDAIRAKVNGSWNKLSQDERTERLALTREIARRQDEQRTQEKDEARKADARIIRPRNEGEDRLEQVWKHDDGRKVTLRARMEVKGSDRKGWACRYTIWSKYEDPGSKRRASWSKCGYLDGKSLRKIKVLFDDAQARARVQSAGWGVESGILLPELAEISRVADEVYWRERMDGEHERALEWAKSKAIFDAADAEGRAHLDVLVKCGVPAETLDYLATCPRGLSKAIKAIPEVEAEPQA